MKNAALPPGKTASHFYPTATPIYGTRAKSLRLTSCETVARLLIRERGVKLIFLPRDITHDLHHRLASGTGLDGIYFCHALHVGFLVTSCSAAAGHAAGYPCGACC